MGLFRPETRIRFWTPKFKHAPDVRPPGILILVSVLCILSVIGTLLFATFRTLTIGFQPTWAESVIIAAIHFLLPIAIAYTVFTNSHLSRPLVLIYGFALTASLFFGIGYFSPAVEDGAFSRIAILASLAIVVAWLYLSPKMRIYYALLRERPLPSKLAQRAIDYVETPWPGRRASEVLNWISEHLETVVLIGLIVTVLLAWASMSG